MKCPECGGEMKPSPWIIPTWRPIQEYFCENCKTVWDYCEKDIDQNNRLTLCRRLVVDKTKEDK
jgi:hypothetical protein